MSFALPRHILLAIDGSPLAQEACVQAAHMAHAFGAAITSVHAAVPRAPRNAMSATEARRVSTEAEHAGRNLLDAAQALVAPLAPCRTEPHRGTPADVIRERAAALAVGPVVAGSRWSGTLDRPLLGSVSAAVVQRAPCTVVVARRPPVVEGPAIEPG